MTNTLMAALNTKILRRLIITLAWQENKGFLVKSFGLKGDSKSESKWLWNASSYQTIQSTTNQIEIGCKIRKF